MNVTNTRTMENDCEQSKPPNHVTNGVTHFLRHFSPRTSSDGLQIKTIQRFKNRKAFPPSVSAVDDTISPTSVTASLNPSNVALLKKKAPRKTFKAEEEMIAFDGSNDGTRLGIRPTCYDIPDLDGASMPASDQEVSFINHIAARTTGTESSTPNLFSSLAFWEESCQLELESNDPQLSPQKSVGSCESDDYNEESSFNTSSSLPIRKKRNKGNCSSGSSVSSTLMSKAKAIVLRARDKDCNNSICSRNSRSLSPMSNSAKSSIRNETFISTNVKIFLLLVEPKSKVFELIQLFYPQKSTKVGDLLKMIPKNATEPTLASQSYVGITRPKRRAEPTFNLNYFASNSVYSTSHPTADIGHGEVIVAIPAHTTTKEIVVLSKQILASAHIQKLIHLSKNHDITVKKTGSKKEKRRRDGCESSTTVSKKESYFATSTLTPRKISSVETINVQEKDFRKNTPKTPKVVSFLDEIHSDDLKRAIDYANVANEEAGRSPCPSPASCFSESVMVGTATSEGRSVEFPRDMLDAYMSKDDVMRMCSTPNNSKVPIIELASSCSMADDTGDTDTDDDAASVDGSMSSSFHSWAQSFDGSMSRLTNQNMIMERQQMASSNQKLQKKKRNQMTRQLKRVAAVLFVYSIVRYHLDPNGIEAKHLHRTNVLFQPMGMVGFLHFFLAFAVFAKIHRFYLRSKMNPPPTKSRCPSMRWFAKLSRKVGALRSEPQAPPPTTSVPINIHFA